MLVVYSKTDIYIYIHIYREREMSNYVLDDKYITWMIDRDTVLIISLTSGGGDGEIERETEKEGVCVCVYANCVFVFPVGT